MVSQPFKKKSSSYFVVFLFGFSKNLNLEFIINSCVSVPHLIYLNFTLVFLFFPLECLASFFRKCLTIWLLLCLQLWPIPWGLIYNILIIVVSQISCCYSWNSSLKQERQILFFISNRLGINIFWYNFIIFSFNIVLEGGFYFTSWNLLGCSSWPNMLSKVE